MRTPYALVFNSAVHDFEYSAKSVVISSDFDRPPSRFRIFSSVCCICSDNFEFSNDSHRHLRAIHFSQALRRQQKNSQSLS